METEYTEKQINDCILRGYFKGKNRFAQAADRVFFCILTAFAAYIAARSVRIAFIGATLIGILAAIGYVLICGAVTSARIKAYSINKEKELRSKLMIRKLLLDDEESVLGKLSSINDSIKEREIKLIRKAAPPEADDILDAVREFRASNCGKSFLLLIVLSEPSARAREFAECLNDPSVELISFFDCGALANHYNVSEAEVFSELMREQEKKPPKRVKLSAGSITSGAGKYRLLGIVLILSSFMMRFSLYAQALGILCLSAAMVFRAVERGKRIGERA